MKKIILLLIAITTIACGCKKYEEGPCISFRSAENRIYGYHDLTSITIDGVEHISEYYDSLSTSFHFYYEAVSSHINACHIDGIRKDGSSTALWTTWELTDHNKILKTTSSYAYTPGVSFGPFKTYVLPEWEIQRLTKNEMKFKTLYINKEYVITLN